MNLLIIYVYYIENIFLWVVHASLFSLIFCNINEDNYEDRSHVEVRAVFIDCELIERKEESFENENTRFQREELFKHNILRDCKKKLALTVKMTSEPGKTSGDEYIPIEHVFDGSKKKRVRLLNPFVLRLRREQPLQAYKIRRIDTINGILINADEGNTFRTNKRNGRIFHTSPRILRTVERKKRSFHTCPITRNYDNKTVNSSLDLYENYIIYPKNNITGEKLVKRQTKLSSAYNYFSPWSNNDYYHHYVQDREVRNIFKKVQMPKFLNSDQNQKYDYQERHITEHFDTSPIHYSKKHSEEYLQTHNFNKNYNVELFNPYDTKTPKSYHITSKESKEETSYDDSEEKKIEKYYAVYEIGKPDLWYTVNIQLYEKLSTPEGKTVWNDITKEEVASVSTMHPEWNNEDLSIRYRSADKRPEDLFLSQTSLCLLVPIRGTETNVVKNDADVVIDNFGEFLVVAIEDIIPKHTSNKMDNASTLPVANVTYNESPRPVLVRTSRAIMGGSTESLMFASSGSEQYLMIPHRRLHHSQIDVESRADANQLIHVGSSGRIIIAASDNTRKKRTVLTLEASNTGLAAARFRVAAKDCFMEALERANNEDAQSFIAGPVLLPPKHTHRFELELPFEIPGEIAHCSGTLINDDDESVAVRDVAIKRNDRCFCVWHCECVCLGDDEKLLCRKMSETRQIAAGLSARKVPRRSRSICYPDNVTLNIAVIVVGVLVALLTLGFIKAVMGLALQCVASWGLERLLVLPRKLDHYYESCLRYRPVIYDDEGWPIHPDTKKRTVRYISKLVEFVLNLIFFVTIPCVILCDTLKLIFSKCGKSQSTVKFKSKPDIKRTYNAEDIQVPDLCPESRCQNVRQWSKSHADELSAVIWQKGLSIHKATDFNYMRSLLRDECCRKSDDLLSYADSEQDDTEYVLMQMQKSRESLAKCQRKISEESAKKQWQDDVRPSTSKR